MVLGDPSGSAPAAMPFTSGLWPMDQTVQLIHRLYTCSAKRRLTSSAAAFRSSSSALRRIVSKASSISGSWKWLKFREMLPAGA